MKPSLFLQLPHLDQVKIVIIALS